MPWSGVIFKMSCNEIANILAGNQNDTLNHFEIK